LGRRGELFFGGGVLALPVAPVRVEHVAVDRLDERLVFGRSVGFGERVERAIFPRSVSGKRHAIGVVSTRVAERTT
jgi:hypothetical protein